MTTAGVGGVLLAGGLSRRMGGRDKALLAVGGETLIGRSAARLGPQVETLIVNANGDPARFAFLGRPVVADETADRPGPLAGVLAALHWYRRFAPSVERVASVSADAPFVPGDLVRRLGEALAESPSAHVAVAQSRGRRHPVIGLWRVEAADQIAAALARGERRAETMVDRLGAVAVPFDDLAVGGQRIDPFLNINTPEELAEAEALLASAVPVSGGEAARRPFVFGVVGWKNAGKTTLVERLVCRLVTLGFSVSTVKHTHHDLDPNDGATDSGRHAAAGARQTAVVSPCRWRLDGVTRGEPEPPLADVLAALRPVDLVIVEGYKAAPIPKIEVRGAGAGGPPLADRDGMVFAIAADGAIGEAPVAVFRRDDIDGLVAAILSHEPAAAYCL